MTNTSVADFGPDLAQLHVSFVYTMPARERQAMRAFIYRNLGLDDDSSLSARRQRIDTLTFVAQGHNASNGRRIDGEAELVQRVQRYVHERHPELRFWSGSFEQLPSFADEVRLLRRTRVYVSLFGSSLHNCRLLPAGSIVIEIHGALREDWHQGAYAPLCAQSMGLRWVGFAAQNAVPAFALSHGAASKSMKASNSSYRRSPDYHTARVDTERFLAVLDAALRANWTEALRAYPFPIFGATKPQHAEQARLIERGEASALGRGTMRQLLGMSQYRTRPAWMQGGPQ